jgi:hypothetical protein
MPIDAGLDVILQKAGVTWSEVPRPGISFIMDANLVPEHITLGVTLQGKIRVARCVYCARRTPYLPATNRGANLDDRIQVARLNAPKKEEPEPAHGWSAWSTPCDES